MKLDPTEQKTSFYETFSDLIFATMAIFVLLMIVFIVQANVKKDISELEQQIQEAEKIKNIENEKLKAVQNHHLQMEKSKMSLEKYNLEVVIAVDTTGSMQRELDQLTETIGLIGQVLPKIATSFKVGIVAYRIDKNERMDIQTFSLQRINDDSKDNSRSLSQLYNFTRNLKAKTGSAPIEQAMNKALKMFSPSESFTGHQCFMLLGDVGPYEDRYSDQTIDANNIQQEKAMIGQLQIWSKEHMHRNVLILFSGEDEIKKAFQIEGSSGPYYKKFVRSKNFFKSLATEIGQPESFSVNSSDMIPNLLASILK